MGAGQCGVCQAGLKLHGRLVAVSLMAAPVRQSKALHTDATKMPYLDPAFAGKPLSGQMWDYVGDRDHPFDLFDFCRDHSARGIDAFLQANGYRGYLNAEA